MPVEQALHTGKRLYEPDNKDSSGMESAGRSIKRKRTREKKEERGRSLLLYHLLLELTIR